MSPNRRLRSSVADRRSIRSEPSTGAGLGLSGRDLHTRRLLQEVEAGHGVSQRRLSQSLGIALGLTNLLVRNVVRKGWVRMIHVKPNRVLYFITPPGLAEKARMSREYLKRSISFYIEARDRIRQQFAALSAVTDDGERSGRIVFFGAGEAAEIGHVCLQETTLVLVGVIDDERAGQRFFGLPVRSLSDVHGVRLGDELFDRLVVLSFTDEAEIRGRLLARGVPEERVFWV